MKQVEARRWRPDRRVAAIGALLAVAAGCSSEPAVAPATSAAEVAPTSGTVVAGATTPTVTTPTVGSTARITDDLSAADLTMALTDVELAAAEGDDSVGSRQQLLYRYLSSHAELDDTVVAGVASEVRPYVERIVRARELGQARAAANQNPTPPSDTLPAWKIIEPLSIDELLADYQAAEAVTGIGWYWLAAIHLQETRMGRTVGTSSAGAVGPMQFLPDTWARCCTGDPTVTGDAIAGAAAYLAQSGGPADMQAALHEYNPNDTYVATVTAFAENMRDNPRLYNAYHEWQVFYSTSAGTVRLPIGYSEAQPIDAATYLADHPDDAG